MNRLPLSALALLAPVAVADVKTYQNDSLGAGGTIACQAGFASNEIGAGVYTVPAGDGPIMLLQAQWYVCDGSGIGFAQARPMQVLVYAAGGPNPGAPLYTSANVSGAPGFLNSFDLPQNLVMQPGQTFTVGVKLLNGSLFQNFSTFATDADGCQSGKSLIFAVPPSQWTDACSLGVSGDMIVRVRVLTQGPVQYGAGLAGTSGVPSIASTGPWTLGSTQFAVTVANAKPVSPGILAYSGAPSSIPLFGGTLLIDLTAPTLLNVASNGAGNVTKPLAIPNQMALAGVHVYFQAGFLDAAAPQGVSLTRGLDVKFSTN
ncbi:MAG: hypothetical protein EPO68_01435 [Planctomycetota bacterium]|nr:MAG: hypothetical protein EPO68_01435 [Planctomycetota bacterium]